MTHFLFLLCAVVAFINALCQEKVEPGLVMWILSSAIWCVSSLIQSRTHTMSFTTIHPVKIYERKRPEERMNHYHEDSLHSGDASERWV